MQVGNGSIETKNDDLSLSLGMEALVLCLVAFGYIFFELLVG